MYQYKEVEGMIPTQRAGGLAEGESGLQMKESIAA